MPRWRAVYVSVPKAACTSLKWLIADLQGESRERFYSSLSREATRAMCVHRRSLWRDTPMLHTLPADELAEISPENGWFVFAVVRHPAARLWSAWQSKFLLQEPWFMEQYGGAPWAEHRVPQSTQEVVEDFHRFARSVAEDPDQPVMKNRHFMAQTALLAVDRMPYSRVYATHEMPRLLDDLTAHLRAHRWQGERLTLERRNETPLRPMPDAFPEDIQDGLRKLYAADYDRFRFTDVLPGGLERSESYTEDALNEVARLVERAERLGDVAVRAQRLSAELAQTRRQLAAATGSAPAPARAAVGRPAAGAVEARVREVARRLPQPVRARLRGVGSMLRGS